MLVGLGDWAVWGRGGPVWSWGGSVWGWGDDWSWGIRSWGWDNNWGGSVGWGRGSSVDGLSRVLNISNISRVGISNIVGDSLDATIGKGNTVLSVGGISVAVLIGGKVESSVLVVDSVVVVVCWGDISVDWSWGISWGWSICWGGGWGVLWGGSSHGDDGEQSNEALEKIEKKNNKLLITCFFTQNTGCELNSFQTFNHEAQFVNR